MVSAVAIANQLGMSKGWGPRSIAVHFISVQWWGSTYASCPFFSLRIFYKFFDQQNFIVNGSRMYGHSCHYSMDLSHRPSNDCTNVCSACNSDHCRRVAK